MRQGNISVEQSNGVAVVVLEGEHDVHTAPSLSGRIDSLLSEGVPVVIDLNGASFIDSSILRALIVARTASQEKSLGFAVCLDQAGESAVQRVFEIARAGELFPVLPSVAEAVERVRSTRSDPS
jgi:anti-sigma B factor antagonist